MTTSIRPLLADHAFVIQLRTCDERSSAVRDGRVEHLASGEAACFGCKEDLWAFVDRVLADLAGEPSSATRGEK